MLQKPITVGDNAPDPVTSLAKHPNFFIHPRILERHHEH